MQILLSPLIDAATYSGIEVLHREMGTSTEVSVMAELEKEERFLQRIEKKISGVRDKRGSK